MTTIHYQVTDTQAICNKDTTKGTTIEARVTCPKCLARLAANEEMMKA